MWSVLLAVSPSRSLSVSLLSLSSMATFSRISELTEEWYNFITISYTYLLSSQLLNDTCSLSNINSSLYLHSTLTQIQQRTKSVMHILN